MTRVSIRRPASSKRLRLRLEFIQETTENNDHEFIRRSRERETSGFRDEFIGKTTEICIYVDVRGSLQWIRRVGGGYLSAWLTGEGVEFRDYVDG